MKKKGYILLVLLCLFYDVISAQITASFVSMRPITGVVTDGLAIHYDAGNNTSYNGTGTTIYD